MSILGIADKVLGILKKPLTLRADPSYRNEKEIKRLEKEQSIILLQKATPENTRRFDDIKRRLIELREEQNRIAART